MSKTFGELVTREARRRGWSDYQLSAAIGLLPGDRPFNPTQIRRLRLGERRNLTRELVARLIEVLDLPEEEAWHAAGLWPPDLDVAGYRRFRQAARAVSPGSLDRARERRRGRDRRRRIVPLELAA